MIGFKLRILVWLLVVSEESWVRHVYNGWFRKKDKKREMFGQLDGGAIIFQFGS